MSAFTDAVAYDLGAVTFTAYEGAEAAEYLPAGSSDPVRVLTRWSPLAVAELGQGFVADVTTVHCTAAALTRYGDAVVPARGDTIIRYPDEYASGLRETWQVEAVRRPGAALWELDVLKAPRPVPGGL